MPEQIVTRFGVQDDFLGGPRSGRQLVPALADYRSVSPADADYWVAVRGNVTTEPIPGSGLTLVLLAPGLGGRLAAALRAEILRRQPPTVEHLGRMLHDHIVGHVAGLVLAPDGFVVFTDHLGSVPVFAARSTHAGAVPIVGTSLRDVARIAGRTVADPVSVQEYVHRGTVVSPFTLYAGVERVWAGAVESWRSPGGGSFAHEACSYWKPVRDSQPSAQELADIAAQAREVLRESVAQLLEDHDAHTLMFSAGEDSRVLAAIIAAQPSRIADVRAVIFLDQLNREYRVARRVAGILDIPLEVCLRQPDHYTRNLPELIEEAGLAFDLTHAHAVGLVARDPSRIVMDGRSADAYLKGYNLPATRGRWGLERPAVQGPLDRHIDGMLAQYAHEAVKERRRQKLLVLAGLRPAADVASWAKLWPATDRMTHGMAWSARVIGPHVFPYGFPRLVQAIAAVPEVDKLNRRFSRLVLNPLLGGLRWIPKSNGSVPGLGPRLDRLAVSAWRSWRENADHARRIVGRPTVAPGAWPPKAWRMRAAQAHLDRLSAHSVREAVVLAGLGDVSDARTTARRERLAHVATAVDLHVLDVP